MESFCHQLNKPPGGRLHAMKASHFINIIIVLTSKGQCFSTELDIRKHPKVCNLLKPCGKLNAFQQESRLTIQNDGEDMFNNVHLDSMSLQQALNEVIEASCEQSKVLAASLAKKRDIRNVSNEACELIMRIERQRKEEFAKFALLLNEKKRKIRELQKQVGNAITEKFDENDYGLSADVQKRSQDTDQSEDASQHEDDFTQYALRGSTKHLCIKQYDHVSDNDNDDEVGVGAGTSGSNTKNRGVDSKDDGEIGRSDDEDLFDSDKEHSVRGRRSESEENRDSEEDIDDYNNEIIKSSRSKQKKWSGNSQKKNKKFGKREVSSDDDDNPEETDDKAAIGDNRLAQQWLKEETFPQKGMKKLRPTISDDENEASFKPNGNSSSPELKTARTMKKYAGSQLEALDDLL